MITTSFSVNGADVGLASAKQNNALKGVGTQWAFLLRRRCLSIAACSAGMLSRWHTEETETGPGPFKFPPGLKSIGGYMCGGVAADCLFGQSGH